MSVRSARFTSGGDGSLVRFSEGRCSFLPAMRASNCDMHTVRQLLRQERSGNPLFDGAWRAAEALFRSRKHHGHAPDECYIAATAYTSCQLSRDFDRACRGLGDPSSWGHFRYKSLFCLLTRAAPQSAPTGRLYRGVDVHLDRHSFHDGALVCFSQFASCAPDRGLACGFPAGRGTVIEFPHGAGAAMDVAQFSAHPQEREVVVFPWSTFRVARSERGGPVHRLVLESAGARKDLGACGYLPHPSAYQVASHSGGSSSHHGSSICSKPKSHCGSSSSQYGGSSHSGGGSSKYGGSSSSSKHGGSTCSKTKSHSSSSSSNFGGTSSHSGSGGSFSLQFGGGACSKPKSHCSGSSSKSTKVVVHCGPGKSSHHKSGGHFGWKQGRGTVFVQGMIPAPPPMPCPPPCFMPCPPPCPPICVMPCPPPCPPPFPPYC